MTALLSVRDLSVTYRERDSTTQAVRGITFEVGPGEAFGLVGESGSGKSTTAFAIVRFLAEGGHIEGGSVAFRGLDLTKIDDEELREVRANDIGMVYQEPARALNPTMRVGMQLAERLPPRRGGRYVADSPAVLELLERVGFSDPRSIAARYPHEMSGGQQQRIVIGMAVAREPDLLILDEATTGLDTLVEAEVLDLVDGLRRDLGTSMLMISHDLGLIASRCDRVSIMQDGVIVESGSATEVLTSPQHAYTRELVRAAPRLDTLPAGSDLTRVSPKAELVRIDGARKFYGQRPALDNVSLSIYEQEVLALIGESGSGKTTLGRAVAGLTDVDGSIEFVGKRIGQRPVQMVFQSPDATLNPRRRIGRMLARSIQLLRGTKTVAELAQQVNIDNQLLRRLPRELSGGQKQRAAIGRAFAGPSSLVVCDEPVSALDVSVQARILALLTALKTDTDVSYLFISHDLAVVRSIADRIAVLYRGRLLEVGPVDAIFAGPRHPYTDQLLRAARHQTGIVKEKIASEEKIPAGCRLSGRCPFEIDGLCATTPPPNVTLSDGHTVLCHLAPEELPTEA
ncbi:ABC transporter ATP-binding protein [Frondihabitans peucedani]|uniref:ABC transporter ATP-binding protein n=1 Tax=Frondihabitans peucedani TaxID=598626 RepID=A0ABP8E1D5_9MICO